MTLTLFEKYEIYRQRYAPGTRWKDKTNTCTVKELLILPADTSNVQIYRGYDDKGRYDDKGLGSRLIKFKILNSNRPHSSRFGINVKLSWSESYMEKCYEPILD